MGIRLTHAQFIEKLNKKQSDIKVLDVYSYSNIKIDVQCKICLHKWKSLPRNLLTGYGCPNCSTNKKLTDGEFKERIYKLNPNIKIDGLYKNMKSRLLVNCLICNHVWRPTAVNLSKGRGCPKCADRLRGEKRALKHTDVINRIKKLNPQIIILNTYSRSSTVLECKCLKCNNTWKTQAHNLLHGTGCPFCRISKSEKYIKCWLEDKEIDFECQKRFKECRDKRPLPFDFYIKSKNLCIEYQGEQHFRKKKWNWKFNLDYIKNHDEMKRDFCRNNNINLREITYKDTIDEELNTIFTINGGAL